MSKDRQIQKNFKEGEASSRRKRGFDGSIEQRNQKEHRVGVITSHATIHASPPGGPPCAP